MTAKLNLRNVRRIKTQSGEISKLKGQGFEWVRPPSDPVLLATYNFETSSNRRMATVEPDISGVIFSNLSETNLNPVEISNVYGYPTGWVYRVGFNGGLSQSLSSGAYFGFTLTPSNSITITNVSLLAARGGASANRGFQLRSSVDNFASPIATIESVPTVRSDWSEFSFDMELISATPIEIRFYLFTNGANASIEFDNIEITGIL